MQKNLAIVKKEEAKEPATPLRTPMTAAKRKEPVRQTAYGEASDTLEDEDMEDNEHLFGMLGPLAATTAFPLLTSLTVHN